MKPGRSAADEGGVRIATAADAYRLLRDGFAREATESLQVAHLDGERRLVALDRYGGAADHLELPLRPILARALAAGARMLVIGHTHPSGDPTPSAGDRIATGRLAALLAAIDVRLADHLVFAGPRCVSFRQLGLL